MEFSSSFSQFTPASSSKSRNHDVFVSFRGQDTGRTFVSHLHSALNQRGILTYKDAETLSKGELINRSLLKAIEESRIAVIVFSKTYAYSTMCLGELAYIMKCRAERGLIVIPIYYDVDPSEVRRQKEAFARHEEHNEDKIESWRKAMMAATDLKGLVADRDDAELIKILSGTLFGLISNMDKDLASSSSFSRFTPASSSKSWKHDVYVSFRGPDTRKIFVGHLYSALDQQGILVYKEDEPMSSLGEPINLLLQKAIEESRIVVIVFSETYAHATWCMDELAYIMKCRAERGQIVIPIFYDVDPSEVRKQTGRYKEAFARHEQQHNKDKFESWGRAMMEAANLKGLDAGWDESKGIKKLLSTLFGLISNMDKDLASSSSFSHFTPASSSKSWKYDVFVSFRGEYTRCTFVNHLYSALDQQGVLVYREDEPLFPMVWEAIEESRIVVIVFSKNYAYSTWCLRELECIMKYRAERGLIVIPIFYDVDPVDVKKQTGEYKEAFARLEWRNNVESWRKAMTTAANLKGLVARWDDTELIKKLSSTLFGLISNMDKDMASSSLFSHFTPASSSKSWKHDVYVSFRGPDTHKIFGGHLYSALDQQGILVYKDDGPMSSLGEQIILLLEKAIEESRIIVIVFSKTYAHATWCLDELAYIMKCKAERGQIVIPIFYDVDPWEVRKQTGRYKEAFARHWHHNKDKIESWRRAIMAATDLKGLVADGDDAELIKILIRTLLFIIPDIDKDRNRIELKIPLHDISIATNKFAEENIIARSGFGNVYRGEYKHGLVAVKQLDRKYGQGDHEFMMEIALLSAYKHENLVSLVGYCDEDSKKILVYMYEINGSLDNALHSKDLTWIQRLRICLGAARGLKYLHDDVGPQHRVLHRDVKSANILLDKNWKAKISDFGLSKIALANVPCTVLISNACGTIGYLDPQYLKRGILTQKSDVYSFGVVLFEVLFGKLVSVAENPDERHFSVKLAKDHYDNKTLEEIIDSDLRNQMNSASLSTFSDIAYQCLKKRGEERPKMSVVVEQLKKALDYQQVVAPA